MISDVRAHCHGPRARSHRLNSRRCPPHAVEATVCLVESQTEIHRFGRSCVSTSLTLLRRWVSVVAAAIGIVGAYGGAAAMLVRLFTDITGIQAFLFVGAPVGLIVAALMWKKLPRILGFENDVL